MLLQKLPFSIKDIADKAPIRTADGINYIGGKNTVMIAIDPRTGKILQQFDSSKQGYNHILSKKKLGPGTIFIGRNGTLLAIVLFTLTHLLFV